MATIKLNSFSGLRPRVPESLLGESDATIAQNCDFAYGELRNTKAGFMLNQLSNPARSLYTEDGLTFFSWVVDVDAVRSPLANDTYNRMYYTGDSGFKMASRLDTKASGGPPGSSYLVGVPRPTVAPSLVMALPTFTDTNCNFSYIFHYEKDGVKYQESTISVVRRGDLMWQFTPPEMLGAFKKFSSFNKFPDSGNPNAVYQDTSTNQVYIWQEYVVTSVASYAGSTQFPSVGEPNVIYADTVNSKLYQWDGETYALQKVKKFKRYSALPANPSKDFVYQTIDNGAYFTNRYVEANYEPKGTPSDAFPVLRVKATYKSDSTVAFDAYSSNSSFAKTNGQVTLITTKDTDAETYTSKLEIGITEADKETRAYVYTYANIYNEEGPPSAPTLVTTSPITNVTVRVTKDSLTGYVPIKEIRIYRTPTGSTIADYFFVASIPVVSSPAGQYELNDSVKASQLNEPLSSTYNYPPNQALTGLMNLPNGIMCAWKDNELHFSEPYKPWAWPPEYVQVLPNRIVGAIANGAGAVVTTTSGPYLLSGVSPDSMTLSRLNVDQAGVSKWSMAIVNGVVAYASNDGIVTLSGATATLDQSLQFFTREVWRQRYSAGLATMRFSVWDGRLIVFSSAYSFTPFMLRLDEANGTMTELPNLTAATAFVSQLSDQCFYVRGQNIYEFNGGSNESAVWQSKEIVIPRPVNFSIAQTLVEGTWTIELWAYLRNKNTGLFDYSRVHWQTLTTGYATFRLPSGFESDRYRVKIMGTGRFRELRLAQSARELSEV